MLCKYIYIFIVYVFTIYMFGIAFSLFQMVMIRVWYVQTYRYVCLYMSTVWMYIFGYVWVWCVYNMSMNSSISLFVRLYIRVESVCVLGEGNGITPPSHKHLKRVRVKTNRKKYQCRMYIWVVFKNVMIIFNPMSK